jgi:tRNA(fMet)-specific endonuclease VapC
MESRRILVDTSIIIEFLRSNNRESTRLVKLYLKNNICVSSITVFELFNGATTEAKQNDIKLLLSEMEVIDFKKETAILASNLYRQLKSQNRLIEFRDILIGATALEFNLPIATNNQKHFERFEKLKFCE